jgi:hypothetical protein
MSHKRRFCAGIEAETKTADIAVGALLQTGQGILARQRLVKRTEISKV